MTFSDRGGLLIKGRLLVGQPWWSTSVYKHMLPCLWYQMGSFPNCGQQSPNIPGNLQSQHWRYVVSSECVSTFTWERRVCYMFVFGQLYSESSFKYKGGSEFNFSMKGKLFASCSDLLKLHQRDTAGQTRTFLVCCWDARKVMRWAHQVHL